MKPKIQGNHESSLSVVVINYNGGDRLLACIHAITLQSYKPRAIFLVDNASTDHSVEAVAKTYPDVNIVRLTDNKGPSAARNAGIAATRTDLTLLMDADIYLGKTCLQKLVLAYRQHSAVICPRIVFYAQPETIQCDGTSAHFIGTLILHNNLCSINEIPRKIIAVGGCPSACLLIETEIARRLGGFDETYFFYFEDLEFDLKLRSNGQTVLCEPDAVVLHDVGRGTSELSYRSGQKYPSQRFYLTIRNRLMTIFTYYRLRTIFLLLPAFVLYETASLMAAIRRGWLLEWLHAWRWQIENQKALRSKRKQRQSSRCLGDRDIMMGGPLPISEGFIQSTIARILLHFLSSTTNYYWQLIKKKID
jgi:GT2 family glycosyltransferase